MNGVGVKLTIYSSGNRINWNDIEGNTFFGVSNECFVAVDGALNWWGNQTGPYHPYLNSNGRGNEVSDNVLFRPWLSQSIKIPLPSTDLNQDGKVDILDIFTVAMAFGSKPGDQSWNAVADLDMNGVIDILDIFAVARDYGKTV
jgi:hypothetical protein